MLLVANDVGFIHLHGVRSPTRVVLGWVLRINVSVYVCLSVWHVGCR